MRKPKNLKTRIFLDSGNPLETKEAIEFMGFLDGQTTNPTLIAEHPLFQAHEASGEKCKEEDVWRYYREIVSEIYPLVKDGSVSTEVYADHETKAQEMIAKGKELFSWIPNAHVKLPTTIEGLKAAHILVGEGVRVNMTLCFSQEQAAAVYAATVGAKKGDVYISPFVGRLDDKGKSGMSLIDTMARMYKKGDRHVEILVASVRNLDHFLYSLQLSVPIITSPLSILKEWAERGMPVPAGEYKYEALDLSDIPYKELDLLQDWKKFNISHELTDKGMDRFSKDWNNLIE